MSDIFKSQCAGGNDNLQSNTHYFYFIFFFSFLCMFIISPLNLVTADSAIQFALDIK